MFLQENYFSSSKTWSGKHNWSLRKGSPSREYSSGREGAAEEGPWEESWGSHLGAESEVGEVAVTQNTAGPNWSPCNLEGYSCSLHSEWKPHLGAQHFCRGQGLLPLLPGQVTAARGTFLPSLMIPCFAKQRPKPAMGSPHRDPPLQRSPWFLQLFVSPAPQHSPATPAAPSQDRPLRVLKKRGFVESPPINFCLPLLADRAAPHELRLSHWSGGGELPVCLRARPRPGLTMGIESQTGSGLVLWTPPRRDSPPARCSLFVTWHCQSSVL